MSSSVDSKVAGVSEDSDGANKWLCSLMPGLPVYDGSNVIPNSLNIKAK